MALSTVKEWAKMILCGLFLGLVFGSSLYFIQTWRMNEPIPLPIQWFVHVFLVSSFHLGEFFLTAIYRPYDLCFKSFLIDQSLYYIISSVSGICEFWIKYIYITHGAINPYVFYGGLYVALFGLILRAVAQVKMEGNFSHSIKEERECRQELITTGVYSVFCHPSYTGWFYFNIGNQILLGNGVSSCLTGVFLWILLSYRIPYEEEKLQSFYTTYREYRKRTHVFIPFLPKMKAEYLCLL